jgi:sugar transferase (PEP-CTERM system associated)
VIRPFNVHYPVRSLFLLAGEAVIVCASFLLVAVVRFRHDFYWALSHENGFYKILGATGLVLLCLHYFDLYNLQRLRSHAETCLRLLTVLGILSLLLAALGYFFPSLMIGRGVFLGGVLVMTMGLFAWRFAFTPLLQGSYLRQRVYVLGAGDRANRLVGTLRQRKDLGMEVVGWAGAIENGSLTREALGNKLLGLKQKGGVDRVILAMDDRRGTVPVPELLELRLSGIRIEEAPAVLEQISGKIEVDDLCPSWLIFSDGFRSNSTPFMLVRRSISIIVSLMGLLLCLPLVPLIILAIKLTSPGPAFYRQKRVGANGVVFNCYKFRTMGPNAEVDTGPTWAGDEDPRITSVGRFLRRTRLDEIPQLWNVLRGDMGFVGPRPERPEFVEWLSREIPYYNLRHLIQPGLTGWAQIRYKYGNSVEDAKEKLQYDLFYLKNLSLTLDLLILFETVKTVLWGEGTHQ